MKARSAAAAAVTAVAVTVAASGWPPTTGPVAAAAAATVGDPPAAVLSVPVTSGRDDAEEAGGRMNRSSATLDLGRVGDAANTTAVRFDRLGLPARAVIRSARIQFAAAGAAAGAAELTVRAHDSDNSPAAGWTDANLTARNRTTAGVTWRPPAWSAGAAGPAARTPDLAPVLQEVVNRRGWWRSSAVTFLVTGSGHRPAVSYDTDPAAAPVLHVEWSTPTPAPAPTGRVRAAVIGDYGSTSPGNDRVAALVGRMAPQAVVTVGDNAYGDHGGADDLTGRTYSPWIGAYPGSYSTGSARNRFWPALGNHDYSDAGGLGSYLWLHTLPGNERYYQRRLGNLHIFVVNSNWQEPDGITVNSTQARWLQRRLSLSDAPWKVVVFHHSPYSSGAEHGSEPRLRWPFAEWGADLVVTGHDHGYERLQVDGIPYIVNGLGGASRYPFAAPLPQSRFRYNAADGALILDVCAARLSGEFRTVGGGVVDRFALGAPAC
mgnify:CR=1 FL=1